jgi:hypothetical protein
MADDIDIRLSTVEKLLLELQNQIPALATKTMVTQAQLIIESRMNDIEADMATLTTRVENLEKA